MRRAQIATFGTLAAIAVVTMASLASSAAAGHQVALLTAASPCASHPPAASDADVTTAVSPGSRLSQNATPSPSPSGSPSPTPTATPTPPPTPILCALVKPSSGSVDPGKGETYAIWVWSVAAEASGTTVTLSTGNAPRVDAPTFTVCSQAQGNVCKAGSLIPGQSYEFQAGVSVQSAATAGEKITLTATVQATNAVVSGKADATISVVAPPSPSPSSSTSTPAAPAGGDTSGLPGTSLPLTPAELTSPTDPSSLFPTVSPGSSVDPNHGRKHSGRSPGATTAAATLPLDSRLIGGQVAGMAVLASAIVIAIARLSLRRPQREDDSSTQA